MAYIRAMLEEERDRLVALKKKYEDILSGKTQGTKDKAVYESHLKKTKENLEEVLSFLEK